jgi:hypothetical protein
LKVESAVVGVFVVAAARAVVIIVIDGGQVKGKSLPLFLVVHEAAVGHDAELKHTERGND